jgi:hypothetical protein
MKADRGRTHVLRIIFRIAWRKSDEFARHHGHGPAFEERQHELVPLTGGHRGRWFWLLPLQLRVALAAPGCCMRMSKLEPPFHVGGEVTAEQDPFDRLDLGRQMLILQPEADRAVAHSDSRRELLHSPTAAGAISLCTGARATQQMPTE